jgi:uncharacterized protein (TIGR02147 family)
MVNIFDYINYREYLEACFNEIKDGKAAIGIAFSYEAFANLLKVNNRSFLWQIMRSKKKKQLTEKYWNGIAHGLKLTGEQTKYLKNIINCTHAREKARQFEAELYFKEAMSCKSRSTTEVFRLRKDQYELLTQWYHNAILELIGMRPINDEFALLGKKLFPSITKTQAKKSIQLLERLELIKKGNDGLYRLTQKEIKVDKEISRTIRNRFHFDFVELAKNQIVERNPQPYTIHSLTLGVSDKIFDAIYYKTKEFKKEIIKIANNEENQNDKVYQYQIFFYPLTAPKKADLK